MVLAKGFARLSLEFSQCRGARRRQASIAEMLGMSRCKGAHGDGKARWRERCCWRPDVWASGIPGRLRGRGGAGSTLDAPRSLRAWSLCRTRLRMLGRRLETERAGLSVEESRIARLPVGWSLYLQASFAPSVQARARYFLAAVASSGT